MLKYGRHINLCNSFRTQEEIKTEEEVDIGNIYYENIYNFIETNKENFNKIDINNFPTTIQIFINNPLDLKNKDISKIINNEGIKKIRSYIKKNNIDLFIHSSYLTKLSSENPNKSMNSLLSEMKSTFLLGGKGIILHCGSKRSKEGIIIKKKQALDNLIKNSSEVINKFCTMLISNLLKKYDKSYDNNENNDNNDNDNNDNDIFSLTIDMIKTPILLFEMSSGSGKEIGGKIKDMIYIIDGIKKNIDNFSKKKCKLCSNMIGICLDTCHMFQNGYNLSTKEGVESIFSQFGEYVKYIKLIHLNDAAYPIGEHNDVHQSIGCGYITKKKGGSFEGFKELLSIAIKNNISIILETQSRNCDKIMAKKLNSNPDSNQNHKLDSELLVVYLLTTKNNKLLYKNIDYCY
jgi:endonuclease IV